MIVSVYKYYTVDWIDNFAKIERSKRKFTTINIKGLLLKYIQDKYRNYKMISTSSLQHELLLSPNEYIQIKKEIAQNNNTRRCPSYLSKDEFDVLIDLYL